MDIMRSLRLTCQIEAAPLADVVRPSGEVDLSTISILGHALAAAFSRGRDVIVDLSEVTYIDSRGLGELLAHHRIYRETIVRWCWPTRGSPRKTSSRESAYITPSRCFRQSERPRIR
jgi:anti-anti-sigma factor